MLHSNVAENQPIMARSASASAHEVDWELTDTQPLDPNRLDGRIEDYSKKGFPPSPVSWDVIVVSDCTYNVDTFSALCSTIRKAAEMSDGLKTWVVVGFKKRHRSETVFSGMIEAKGFDLIERKTMGGDEPTGEMEVHYYRYK